MQSTKVLLLRSDEHTCAACGKHEVMAAVMPVCKDCWEAEAADSKQEALRHGLYRCEECKKGDSWWRRRFPRKARHFVNGKHVCNMHAVAEALKNAGKSEPEDGLVLSR